MRRLLRKLRAQVPSRESYPAVELLLDTDRDEETTERTLAEIREQGDV